MSVCVNVSMRIFFSFNNFFNKLIKNKKNKFVKLKLKKRNFLIEKYKLFEHPSLLLMRLDFFLLGWNGLVSLK